MRVEEYREDWGGGVPTFTVEMLRAILANVPDDTHVVLATEQWYANVGSMIYDPEDGMFAFTLFPADDFDTRQF